MFDLTMCICFEEFNFIESFKLSCIFGIFDKHICFILEELVPLFCVVFNADLNKYHAMAY